MDAAQALADLTEISAQIEAAVLAAGDGTVVASTFPQEGKGAELARAAAELVAAASGESRGNSAAPELVQIQAATLRGSFFVVRDGGHLVAAVTGSKPTVGLLFYDLKTCLRMLEREEAKAEKAAKGEKTTAAKAKVGKASSSRRRTTTKKKDDEGS
jgi:predicted regulator of Ras-like GTPase activity (Roadblock/LC7/MglB family)